MTADEKVARQKLSVLELAQALGNVTEAVRSRESRGPNFTNM